MVFDTPGMIKSTAMTLRQLIQEALISLYDKHRSQQDFIKEVNDLSGDLRRAGLAVAAIEVNKAKEKAASNYSADKDTIKFHLEEAIIILDLEKELDKL